MSKATLKGYVQKAVNYLGYKIEWDIDAVVAPIDVFDLVLRQVASQVSEFFFVQIGANDGVTRDPIWKYVTKYHWRGLLIEPVPDVFAKLVQNYAQETQLVFENVAVAPYDGVMSFFTVADLAGFAHLAGHSSVDKNYLAKKLRARVPVKEIKVPCLSIPTLLAKHSISQIDLLQIDAESYDFEIIKMFDMKVIKPTVIQFEHAQLPADQRKACYRYLAGHGYRCTRCLMDTVAYLQTTDT